MFFFMCLGHVALNYFGVDALTVNHLTVAGSRVMCRFMVYNFNCSEYDPTDYRDKKLMVFENERSGRSYDLSTFRSPDERSFALIRTATGLASVSPTLTNEIAIVEKQIDETTLRMMERPNSRFLNNQCDWVLFLNSPLRRKQFTEPKVLAPA